MPTLFAALALAAAAYAPANHARPLHKALATHAVVHVHAARSQNALESGLLEQINAVRGQNGLRPFRLSARLGAAARQHSLSMAGKGYFSHDSANGTAFWRRIASFYGYNGYSQWSVGENLLWSSPDTSVAGALHLWLTSPEHRANLLDRSWREIGLSAVHVPSAPGVYGGSAVTIVTADFGVRY
ncbi:MAG TPA: CAP domain-containing protein [Gaiellaceae bacterium]